MYWNVESATETQGSSSWIVTLDVLKYTCLLYHIGGYKVE